MRILLGSIVLITVVLSIPHPAHPGDEPIAQCTADTENDIITVAKYNVTEDLELYVKYILSKPTDHFSNYGRVKK